MAGEDVQEVVAKTKKLMSLAIDDPDSEESRTAAVKALQMMKENDLVLVPREYVERATTMIGEATALAAQSKQEQTKHMLLGGVLGWVLGSGKFTK